MKLRREIEEACRDATQKIADGIRLKAEGGLVLSGTPRVLLGLIEFGVKLGHKSAAAYLRAKGRPVEAERVLAIKAEDVMRGGG